MAKNIARTTGKGGNFRKASAGAGMTEKGVAAYRRANPDSKLKTADTEKKNSKMRAKRRKTYSSRYLGQMKMNNIKCTKNTEKRIWAARRRWRC